ncbi:DUF3813 family protein [Piscibacillus halophilus]|uniref:DUF3813 domain-containing protein n=1 Tax=Piscibacillus halophilus TaxID=571933 RepID=A0A1H9B384_9BACI|nr:DUF3813 family protein [Piscibacillus halophilus]SEP83197.1 Protein of unknown function [Piscibacillus halophilus]
MENNFLQQAKQTVQKLTNRARQNNQNHQNHLANDEEAVRSAQQGIQSAYEQGSPSQEEEQELKQFEQKLNNKLK